MRGGLLGVMLLAACTVSPVSNGVQPIVACAADADCAFGFHCLEGGCQSPAVVCAVSSDCQVGQQCRHIGDGGFCQDLAVTYCKPCVATFECAEVGGYCTALGGARVCSQACASCDAGSSCQVIDVPDAGQQSTCLPVSGTCP